MRFAVVHIFSVLLIAGNISAQTVIKTNADTTQPVKKEIHVNVMNPNGKQTVEYKGKVMHTDSVANAMKINLFNLSRGDYEIYCEHRFSDAFSAEAGIGATYIDYIYELSSNGGKYISVINGNLHNAKFYSGFAGGLQLRYYPSRYETAITGYYLAAGVTQRNYKMDYYVFTGLISEPHRVERNWTDFKIQFGYQDADPYERFFWEWYVSAGVRHAVEDKIEGDGLDAIYDHYDTMKLVIGGGVKIGFNL
ncbi:MAG: hypothetical protein HY064_07485 [Bacteroidetes bacterium]|nr:hypothetical protein [Bacteroidota bacterium]